MHGLERTDVKEPAPGRRPPGTARQLTEQVAVPTKYGTRILDVVVWPKGSSPTGLKGALWALESKLGKRAGYPAIQRLKDVWIELKDEIDVIVLKAFRG